MSSKTTIEDLDESLHDRLLSEEDKNKLIKVDDALAKYGILPDGTDIHTATLKDGHYLLSPDYSYTGVPPNYTPAWSVLEIADKNADLSVINGNKMWHIANRTVAGTWIEIYTTANKPTPTDIGASPSDHAHKNQTISPSCVELSPAERDNHGGYIDFHFAGSGIDYTARIIEASQGVLSVNGKLVAEGNNDYSVGQVRNIYAGTTALTPGVSSLANNTIYLQFE